VTDEYWAPVGVWQVREGVRNAFERGAGDASNPRLADQPAEAETFRDAVTAVAQQLPVSLNTLRRKSDMVAGLQSQITDF